MVVFFIYRSFSGLTRITWQQWHCCPVRKQVDLINAVQSNRYGFPVVSALPTEGILLGIPGLPTKFFKFCGARYCGMTDFLLTTPTNFPLVPKFKI